MKLKGLLQKLKKWDRQGPLLIKILISSVFAFFLCLCTLCLLSDVGIVKEKIISVAIDVLTMIFLVFWITNILIIFSHDKHVV